jgi:hypothetical protein
MLGTTTYAAPSAPCCNGAAVAAPVIPPAVPAVPTPTFHNHNANPAGAVYEGGQYRAPAGPATLAPLTTQAPQRTWTFRPVSTQNSTAPEQPKNNEPKSADGWRAAKR